MYCGRLLEKFHNLPVLARRAIVQLHLWIGVVTGLYLFVVCATGAALVFRIDMQRALYPSLFTPPTAGPLAHPADIMESVQRAFPDDRVSGVDAPTTVRPTYLAYSSHGTRFRTLLLDPGSAMLLGELNDIAMWAATGFSFAFPAAFRSMINRISPIGVARSPQSGPRTQEPAPTWRALIDRAREHAPPNHHVARVVTPSNSTAPFLVMFSAARPAPPGAPLLSVYLDQYTGALLSSPSPSLGDRIMAWVAPLHIGNFAGNAVRILWLVLGLAPPLLFVTGFTMWWTRVVRPRGLRLSARRSDLGFER